MADDRKFTNPPTEHALIRFMNARLDERQQRAELALEAISGEWDHWAVVVQQLVACCDTVPAAGRAYQMLATDGDPAQILRDVDAKRRLIEDYRIAAAAIRLRRELDDLLYVRRDTLASSVRTLAAAWSEHPDYAEAVRHG